MKEIKSIVLYKKEGPCVVGSLREDDNGKQFVSTFVLPYLQGKDFLVGQEVDLKLESVADSDYPYKIYPKCNAVSGDLDDQHRRLCNIKEMMEMSLLTDTAENVLSEYSEGIVQNQDEFDTFYKGRLRRYYLDAAITVVEESYARDADGDIDMTDEEYAQRRDLDDKSLEMLNVHVLFPDYNDQIQRIAKSARQGLEDYFMSAYSAIKYSHENSNNNNNTRAL